MDLTEIDGFRLIKSLHTTARQLLVCYKILTIIGKRQLPKDILRKLILDWSYLISKNNETYTKRKGKLTEGDKATTALDHYIHLCESLNLVASLNNTYTCTRSAEILLSFSNEKETHESLGVTQKIFFFSQLIALDMDGLLLALQILKEEPAGLAQKELQIRFKDSFNERLTTKQSTSNDQVRNAISEQYRLLNYTWQKPEKYSEHLLVPRYEWLFDLNLINIQKKGGATNYSLNAKGELFLDSLPSINKIKDVNYNWITQEQFKAFSQIYDNRKYSVYQLESPENKRLLLGTSLKNFKKLIKLSNSFRYPLYDTLLFISMNHFEQGIITEFDDSLEKLRIGFLFEGLEYNVNETGRINESYISIQLKNEI